MAVRSLRAEIKKFNPDCIFLVETKIHSVGLVCHRLGFSNFLEQPPVCCKRGLAFAWRPGLDFEVVQQSQHIPNLLIFSDLGHVPWMLTLIYGPTTWQDKTRFWQQMNSLSIAFAGAWLCIGNFNALTSQHDKFGGNPVSTSPSSGMRHFMLCHGLVDLGFSRPRFTWSNKRKGRALIQERLDRGWAMVLGDSCSPVLLSSTAPVQLLTILLSFWIPLVIQIWGPGHFALNRFGCARLLVV